MKLLKALHRKNSGRPPVWLMRQAGRYLPEYRALREKYSLRELFFTPELAATVTLMPLKRFPLDAAIVFSDITVVALALGLELDFREGPIVTPKVTPQTPLSFAPEKFSSMIEAIKLLKLSVPLLGFCGAPFTVASYLAEDALHWLRSDPVTFHQFLQKIEVLTKTYLQYQVDAGVDAIQIFDSWANVLTKEEFLKFSLPYVRRLIESVKVPSIFFMRGGACHLDELSTLPAALSLDWEISLADVRQKIALPLQGNLHPELLFESLPIIRKKTKQLLVSMQDDPAFILNLGHGIKPGTPVEAVQTLIEAVG